MDELKEQIKEALFYTSALNAQENKYILPIVYTLYDKNNRAVYIGSSQSLTDRLDWHKRKEYWKDIKKIGIRVYPDREQMRIGELILIFKKKPILNRDCIFNDNKEILCFSIPGVRYKDNTREAIFDSDEL